MSDEGLSPPHLVMRLNSLYLSWDPQHSIQYHMADTTWQFRSGPRWGDTRSRTEWEISFITTLTWFHEGRIFPLIRGCTPCSCCWNNRPQPRRNYRPGMVFDCQPLTMSRLWNLLFQIGVALGLLSFGHIGECWDSVSQRRGVCRPDIIFILLPRYFFFMFLHIYWFPVVEDMVLWCWFTGISA